MQSFDYIFVICNFNFGLKMFWCDDLEIDKMGCHRNVGHNGKHAIKSAAAFISLVLFMLFYKTTKCLVFIWYCLNN